MGITRDRATDGVATLTMDDGKANAFDLGFFTALDAALDECADDAAVVLTGRPGMFSGGLNTRVMAEVDEAGLTDLLVQFGRTLLRVWLEPRPIVAAVGGHAVAGGTILAMVCDHAVAAAGPYRWGLTETTIGFPIPAWVIAVARANVRADRVEDLILPGALIEADEAVSVGFADALAEPDAVLAAAQERARHLAGLPRAAYAATKRRLRGPTASSVLDDLVEDTRRILEER